MICTPCPPFRRSKLLDKRPRGQAPRRPLLARIYPKPKRRPGGRARARVRAARSRSAAAPFPGRAGSQARPLCWPTPLRASEAARTHTRRHHCPVPRSRAGRLRVASRSATASLPPHAPAPRHRCGSMPRSRAGRGNHANTPRDSSTDSAGIVDSAVLASEEEKDQEIVRL